MPDKKTKRRISKLYTMKKTAIFFSFLLAIVFVSCKKDKTEPYTETDTTPAAAHPLGYLKNSFQINILSDTIPVKKQYSASAYFYSDSTSNTLVNVDSLSVNDVYLKMRTNKMYYSFDSTTSSESKWHVQGSNGVPVFDYAFAMPSYAGYTSLPDSIDLKQDLIISLSPIQDYTKGSISIIDVIGKRFLKEFKAGDSSVTFTTTELSSLRNYSSLYFYINLYNQQKPVIQGSLFSFENQLTIDKYMVPY